MAGKKLSAEKLAAIRGRSEATHLDYPLSRAVHDVESLLGHIEALEAAIKSSIRVANSYLRKTETGDAVSRETAWVIADVCVPLNEVLDTNGDQ